MHKRGFGILIIIWTLLILSAGFVNIWFSNRSSKERIKASANSFFKEIVTTRSWNALHGGVYVRIDSDNLPNPYLKVPNRDLFVNDTLSLTLINPAYMTRQIGELAQVRDNVHFHITSLRPIREANHADAWETEALKSFENGNPEYFERVKIGDSVYYRYMAPLWVEPSCLKCHAKQGYHLGDIRGGISVSLKGAPYDRQYGYDTLRMGVIYIVIFFLGLWGLLYARKYTWNQFKIIRDHNRKLREHEQKLKQNNRQMKKLISVIAHDLRGPIGNLMVTSDLLNSDDDGISPEHRRKLVANLHRSAESTYELLLHLLSWAKAKRGTMPCRPEKIPVGELVDDAVQVLQPAAKSKSLILTKNVDPVQIYADRDMMSTVFRNILGNSVKFTHHGGRIRIEAHQATAGSVDIIVEDSGVGISKELIDQLFQSGEITSSQGTDGEKGTGLGLLLVKEFIETNKGKLRIESEPGKGTRVILSMPAG